MKRKHLWIAVAACCGTLAAVTLSTTALAATTTKTMPALTGWNLDNAATVDGASPDGRTWLYPDAATRIADVNQDGTGSTGFVIWELDDASGTSPGIQVRTDEPLTGVDSFPLRNCIMASGERAGIVKKCGDPQDSSKRFKLRVTGSETEPVDLVFDVGSDDFTYDDTLNAGDITSRIYRVLMKWANFTDLRAQGFKVQVGFGTGDEFVAATGAEGITFELSTTVTRASLGDAGGGAGREVWKPLEFATFSPGQYSGAPGFFDNQVAGLIPPQEVSPTLIYSGAAPSAWANGAITQNYFDRWGYMLNLALLPTGIYEDADGIAATEGKLKAFWDGTNWRYGFADGFAVVPDSVLASWGAQPLSETQVLQPLPRYEAAVIDDLGGLNVDVFIKLAETYNPAVAGQDKITLRLTPVAPAAGIPGNEDLPAWLANPAPDIFAGAVPPPSGGGGGGGCAIGGDGRFDPTLPALAAAGLAFFGLRRFKASK